MKYLFFIVLFGLFSQECVGATCMLNVKIQNAKDIKHARLSYMKEDGHGNIHQVVVDSIPLDKEEFFYSTDVDDITMVNIWYDAHEFPVVAYLEPGHNTTVFINTQVPYNYSMSGTSVDGQMKDYLFALYNINKVCHETLKLENDIKSKAKEEKHRDSKLDTDILLSCIAEKRDSIFRVKIKQCLAFVEKHVNCAISADVLGWILDYDWGESTAVSTLYKRLPDKTVISLQGKVLRAKLETARRTSCIRDGHSGDFAPNIKVKTINGDMFYLDKMKDKKHVLLLLWSSWSMDTDIRKQQINELRRVYTKYKDKGLEIVGISADYDSTACKKSIAQNRMDWVQTIDREWDAVFQQERMPDFLLYPRTEIPQYYFINKEGRITNIWQEFGARESKTVENDINRSCNFRNIVVQFTFQKYKKCIQTKRYENNKI